MLSLAHPVWDQEQTQVIGYRDHLSPARIYLMPSSLTLVQDRNGRPQFSLFAYAGGDAEGWRLSFKLRLEYPSLEPEILADSNENTPVVTHLPVQRAQARLSMLIPELDETEPKLRKSEWYDIQASADGLTAVAVELSPAEGGLLKDLLTAENLQVEALNLDVRLDFTGLRGAHQSVFGFFPAKFDAFLKERMALLAEDAEEEEAASVSASKALALAWSRDWLERRDHVSFSPATSGADAKVQDEVVLRLFEAAWQQDAGQRYRPRPLAGWSEVSGSGDSLDDPANFRLSWNLCAPVVDQGCWEDSWAFGEFWSGLDAETQDKLFAQVPAMQPLDLVPIHIANTIPLDVNEVRKVAVKLHLFGLSQTWEDHEVVFDANSPVTQTQWAVVPRQIPFSYYSAPELFFGMPEGGGWPPPPIRRDFSPRTDPYLPITPSTFGLDYLRLEAQIDALDAVGFVEIQLSQEISEGETPDAEALETVKSVKLSPSNPCRAVVRSSQSGTHFCYYRIVVHPEEGSADETVVTQDWSPITQSRILVTAFHTHVIHPDIIKLSLVPGADFQVMRVLVHLRSETAAADDEGQLLLLDEEQPETSWAYWRTSLFQERSFQWRAELYFAETTALEPRMLPWASSSDGELVFDARMVNI